MIVTVKGMVVGVKVAEHQLAHQLVVVISQKALLKRHTN